MRYRAAAERGNSIGRSRPASRCARSPPLLGRPLLLSRDVLEFHPNPGAERCGDAGEGLELQIAKARRLEVRDDRLTHTEALGELPLREPSRFSERNELLSNLEHLDHVLDVMPALRVLQERSVDPLHDRRVGRCLLHSVFSITLAACASALAP